MIRRVACVILLGVVLVVPVLFHNVSVLAQPRTWSVDDDGVADFRTIQDAVNAASSGDTVLVKSGVYYEHVVLNKSISLIGESKETTAIDALGFGTAFTIVSDNASITGFTVHNAGQLWGPPVGEGYPDSCVLANGVLNVRVEGNVLADAAVGVWVSNSSYTSVVGNIVTGSVYAGIVGYASSNISIQWNTVERSGSTGVLLDFGCVNSTISDNRLTNNLKGLELNDASTANRIERNVFSSNGVSIVMNNSGSALVSSRNIFRDNNMSGNQRNLVVWGSLLWSFMQDIDSSNLIDGRKIYYLIGLRDLAITPSSCPNLGYLALIDSLDVSVRDIIIPRNGDGMLLAASFTCEITNLTISGNSGPLMWGGLTFWGSNANTVSNSHFSNNSYGVAFLTSDHNRIYRNTFIANQRHVVSDFASPFSNQSSGYYSSNTWNNDVEGNHWSDYRGVDADEDGIGDTPYVIDASNADNRPLILVWSDRTPPTIEIYYPGGLDSPGFVARSSSLTIIWRAWDEASDISHYEVRLDEGLWAIVNSTANDGDYPESTFVDLSDGLHTVDIKAVDTAGNVRQERFEFVVDTLIPRVAPIIIVVAIAIAVGAYLFFLKRILSPRRSKVTHRMLR